ncbi:MAG: hypothetical protein U1E73_10325 [Planctomycetota bacterium]
MNSVSQRAPLSFLLDAAAATALAVALANSASAQGSFGLEQRCQFPSSTVSLDTPTASVANNFNFVVQVANSQLLVRQYPNIFVGMNHLCGATFTAAVPTLFGPVGGNRIVDNKVICDGATGRFCVIGMQQDSVAVGPNPNGQGLYVAFSDSAFPTANPSAGGSGGWHSWRTPVPAVPAPGVYQPDFNGLGQTDTHFVYSGILQPITYPAGPAFTFVRCIPKSAMTSYLATLPYVDFVSANPVSTSAFLHAADNYDAGTPIYLASVLVANQQLRLVRANLTTGNEDQFLLNVAPFSPAVGAAPQPGVNAYLDTIDGRMQSVVVRDGMMYCCHTIVDYSAGPGRHVIRWYQIALNGWPNGTGVPTIMQSGNIDHGGQAHAFMPALAVNSNGTLAITYTFSSATQYPSLAWRGRFCTDAVNTMTRGATLYTGTLSYTTSNGTGGTPNADRWGDWGSIVPRNVPNNEGFIVCGPTAVYGAPQLYPTGLPWPPNHWGTRIETFFAASPAWRTFYGAGTAGTNGVPTITGYPRPRIGQTMNVTVTNPAGAPSLGVTLLSQAQAAGVASPFGPLWADPTQGFLISFTLGVVDGTFPIAFPTDPTFIGQPLFLQGAVVDGGSPTSFALTGGMQINVGS